MIQLSLFLLALPFPPSLNHPKQSTLIGKHTPTYLPLSLSLRTPHLPNPFPPFIFPILFPLPFYSSSSFTHTKELIRIYLHWGKHPDPRFFFFFSTSPCSSDRSHGEWILRGKEKRWKNRRHPDFFWFLFAMKLFSFFPTSH